MTAYTSGQWTPYSDGHVIDIRPVATGAAEVSTIARLYPSTPLAERWANARLIAAAPEMLEALREMVAGLDQQALGPDDVARARAAIAKAEGRS